MDGGVHTYMYIYRLDGMKFTLVLGYVIGVSIPKTVSILRPEIGIDTVDFLILIF